MLAKSSAWKQDVRPLENVVHVVNLSNFLAAIPRNGAVYRENVVSVDGKTPVLSSLDDPLHAAHRYDFRDGNLITLINGTPFRVPVYKLEENLFAARSYEFGYANYEVD